MIRNLRITAQDGIFNINKSVFFGDDNNTPTAPKLIDALDYMALSDLKEFLVGNYTGESGFTEDGKWKDISGKNQHARINNPSNVKIVNVKQNPMRRTSRNASGTQAGINENYEELLPEEETVNKVKRQCGGLRSGTKVLKGFTTHEPNEAYRNVASVEFPQDLTPHNYTIFYITRWGPDYDKDELKKVRVNKPWSDSGINAGDIFTEDPNISDVGFNMNKVELLQVIQKIGSLVILVVRHIVLEL